MRRNIHNVMSDALNYIDVRENDVSIEFDIRGQVGHITITSRPNNNWQASAHLDICISYEDGQADPTVFVEFNNLFRQRTLNDLMEYLGNHPIEIGD
jgi:hypothetical protein